MENRKNYSMSTLRTVAIILVVLLHVNALSMMAVAKGELVGISANLVTFISVITRIAVALFVMISGRYVIKSLDKMTVKEFYKKRVIRLIIPLIAWSLIYFIFCYFGIPGTTFGSYMKDFATGFAFNPLNIHMWYLYMLLGLYLVSPILYKFLKGTEFKKALIMGISLCIFGSITEMIKSLTGTNIWIFWWLEFMGLFTLGYVLSEYKVKKKSYLLIGAIAVEVLATIVSIILINQGNQAGMIFHGGVVLNTQVTTILVYMFFNNCDFKDNLLSKASKYTLGIYLLHPVLIVTVMSAISTGIVLLDIVLKTIGTYLISLGIIFLLSKIKALRVILQ